MSFTSYHDLAPQTTHKQWTTVSTCREDFLARIYLQRKCQLSYLRFLPWQIHRGVWWANHKVPLDGDEMLRKPLPVHDLEGRKESIILKRCSIEATQQNTERCTVTIMFLYTVEYHLTFAIFNNLEEIPIASSKYCEALAATTGSFVIVKVVRRIRKTFSGGPPGKEEPYFAVEQRIVDKIPASLPRCNSKFYNYSNKEIKLPFQNPF